MVAPRRPAASPSWRNRILELRYCRPDELVDHPKQWRIHPEHQRQAMLGILDEVGIAGAALAYVSPSTGQLTSIDGHLRKSLGDVAFPTLILDLNDAEADLMLASTDPLSAMADGNALRVSDLLSDIQTSNGALHQMLEALAVEYKAVPPQPYSSPHESGTAGALVTGAGAGLNTTPHPDMPTSQIHMVQLFLAEETWPPFKAAVDRLGYAYACDTITDTVVACVSRAAEALPDAEE